MVKLTAALGVLAATVAPLANGFPTLIRCDGSSKSQDEFFLLRDSITSMGRVSYQTDGSVISGVSVTNGNYELTLGSVSGKGAVVVFDQPVTITSNGGLTNTQSGCSETTVISTVGSGTLGSDNVVIEYTPTTDEDLHISACAVGGRGVDVPCSQFKVVKDTAGAQVLQANIVEPVATTDSPSSGHATIVGTMTIAASMLAASLF
mmetsp:Transcript_24600/g.53622  ORF Transcript_24600/g.53622 Transcript_24600/m.53622 type:complete len:205 (+) Transcript_24600:50-664(+)